MSATITGNVKDISGGAFYLVDVMFEFANSAILIVDQSIVAAGKLHFRTLVTGDLPSGVLLSPGDYRVTVNQDSRNSCLIRVPKDTASHNLVDLIISAVSEPAVPGGSTTTPVASSTTAGKVKTDTNSGDPVVYLKSTVDTLLAALNPSGTFWKSNRAELKAVVSTAIPTNAGAILGPGSTDGMIARWNATDATADNGGTVIQPVDAPTLGRWTIFF